MGSTEYELVLVLFRACSQQHNEGRGEAQFSDVLYGVKIPADMDVGPRTVIADG